MSLQIVPLDKAVHDRKGFDCGNEARNQYLKTLALQHARRGLSRTFALADDSNPGEILGFYSISAAQVRVQALPNALASRLPRFPIPATRAGQLAVQKALHGKGYGGLLLQDAVRRSLAVRESMGVYLLLVDADSEQAAGFYRHFGFEECNSEVRTLFLGLGKG